MLATPSAPDTTGSRVGGLPSLGSLAWPTCGVCATALQFLAQFELTQEVSPRTGLLVLFACPVASCVPFDPTSGANWARVISPGAIARAPTPEGVLGFCAGVELLMVDVNPRDGIDAYDLARIERAHPRTVLGQLGGDIAPVETEVPRCTCGLSMHAVLQLEEGPDANTAINFGGGCGFAFVCSNCEGEARLLFD